MSRDRDREEERHREQMMATIVAALVSNCGYNPHYIRDNEWVRDQILEAAGKLVAKIQWDV